MTSFADVFNVTAPTHYQDSSQTNLSVLNVYLVILACLEKVNSIEEDIIKESLNTDVSPQNFRYSPYKLYCISPEINSSTC